MRYRNVESVRMTEQANREQHNGNGSKKEHAHVAQGVGRVEPSTLQRKTQRKNTKRRHKTWVLHKPGFELKLNHAWKQRLKRKMKSTTRMMKVGEGGEEGGEVAFPFKGALETNLQHLWQAIATAHLFYAAVCC